VDAVNAHGDADSAVVTASAAVEGAAWPRSVVQIAQGILVGRLGCTVDQALTHLVDLAEGSGRGLVEVATSLVSLPGGADAVRRTAFLRPLSPTVLPPTTAPSGVRDSGGDGRSGEPGNAAPGAAAPLPGSAETVQRIFDVLPGSVALIAPVRGPAGTPVDWCIVAVTPDTGDLSGRRPADMAGRTLLELYPGLRGSAHFAVYERVLSTGTSEDLGPFPYTQQRADVPRDAQYVMHVHRFGEMLLVAYVRVDTDRRLAERRAGIERLGNLGWVVWNQLDGHVECSEQLYAILERDRGQGPPTVDEYGRLIHPDDFAAVHEAFEALLSSDAPYDVQYRIVVAGRTKHVRSVAEIIRDAAGRPIEMSAIVQDISATARTRQRLAVIRHELQAHQQLLAEEHRLASQLQQIILPVPAGAVTLPGLQVAVRYLPAEELAKVGGDWFHAAALPDGSVLLAIGDVAGHGLGAAATMARLRHAVAGLALLTHHPAKIMQTLNTMLCRNAGGPVLASAVIARFQPGTRVLTYAQAGHPPLLVARGASVRSLRRPRGIMLGAVPGGTYGRARVVLDARDVLLFFTDGLVESPRVTLDAGLAALTESMRRRPPGAVQSPVHLIRQLTPVNLADDTCILVARLDP
jgi:serine phosphatase RsbU (regulator of sigma subunit)